MEKMKKVSVITKSNKSRKKCKNTQNKCKNTLNLVNNKEIVENCKHYKASEETNLLIQKAYDSNLITYIKALLEAYKSIPRIIGIIDRIIENKASTIPMHSVYGDSYLATYNDVNKVINMTDRKNKLLNIYVIVETILKNLAPEDRKVAVLKYVQKNTTDDIAKDMNLSTRAIFRKCSRVVEKMAIYCLNKNWTTEFLKFQTQKEQWISEIFNEKIKEEQFNKAKGRHPEKLS